MSSGLSRRRSGKARAASQTQPTIERDKIRRPRSVEPELVESSAPSLARSQSIYETAADDADGSVYDDGVYYDSPDPDWTLEEDEPSDASAWDEDSEADWVLDPNGDDEEGDIYAEDEGGVIWEDDVSSDQLAFDDSEEIAFGAEDPGYEAAPEVELAGRRDVAPKAPRPALPPRQKASRQAQPRQPRPQEQPGAHQAQPARPSRAEREGHSQPAPHGPPPRQAVFEPAPQHIDVRPAASSSDVTANAGMPARTRTSRGTSETLIVGDDHGQVLQHPRGGSGQRRRQAQSGPSFPPSGLRGAASRGRRSGKGWLITLALCLALGVGGWFAYQRIDPTTIQPAIDRLTSIIPLPGSTRTAADSSFNDEVAPDIIAAEQALSDLGESIDEQTTTSQANGPPIPKLKPLPGQVSSSSPTRSVAAAEDEPSSADSRDGTTREVSILEQLWQYINPG